MVIAVHIAVGSPPGRAGWLLIRMRSTAAAIAPLDVAAGSEHTHGEQDNVALRGQPRTARRPSPRASTTVSVRSAT